MNEVVVSFITKDSATKMRNFGAVSLVDVLNSTLQVPYRTIILVDDSSDDTRKVFREWCAEHDKELIISSSRLYGLNRPTRATARQTAIDIFFESFSNDFLMFVDDDCVLKDGWWRWVEENNILQDPKVGEVWGINWDSTPERERFLKIFGIKLEDYLIRKFSERGGTHDTIYRREAIEGIKIPPELHVYEDAFLHKWVVEHGWKSVVNPVGVLHYHLTSYFITNPKSEKEKLKLGIYAAQKYGIVEYEYARLLMSRERKLSKRILMYLSMIRPILGLAPMLFITTRAFGLKHGIREAFLRQYLKLWFRWQVARNIGKLSYEGT